LILSEVLAFSYRTTRTLEGDLEPKLTVFVNHPKDKSSKDFICQAFPEIKYYDIGVSEPAPSSSSAKKTSSRR